MNRRFYFCIAILFLRVCAIAQPLANQQLHSVIPPSPDAASLGKYGDIPVNYATGVPDITIPVYTISQSGLQVPVSISYHAGGIKVEERASWVGLGWSLNAGGAITRSIVGLPDEDEGGYFEQSYDIDNIVNLSTNEQAEIADAVRLGMLDLEPDIFYFNFMGRSGKFYIDKSTMKPVIIPQNANLAITFTNSSHAIGTWEIKDEAGNTYLFQTKEMSSIQHGGRLKLTTPMFQHAFSTWYLTSVTTPFGNTITFNYQDYTSDYYTRQSASKYYLYAYTGGCELRCS